MVFYFCDICDFKTHNKTDYNRHFNRPKHNKNVIKLETCDSFECSRCNYKFLSKIQLEEHETRNSVYIENPNMVDRKCNDFTCFLCKSSYSFSKALRTHQTHCEGASKYANNIKPQTLEKKKQQLRDFKNHVISTGGNVKGETIGDIVLNRMEHYLKN